MISGRLAQSVATSAAVRRTGSYRPASRTAELGGVHAHGQPGRAGIDVVAAERPLPAQIERALPVEGQRMRRNHRTTAQRAQHVFRQVLAMQPHACPFPHMGGCSKRHSVEKG